MREYRIRDIAYKVESRYAETGDIEAAVIRAAKERAKEKAKSAGGGAV